jgi:hypothetical protein
MLGADLEQDGVLILELVERGRLRSAGFHLCHVETALGDGRTYLMGGYIDGLRKAGFPE